MVNAILGQIRDCDLFVFILTPRSLDSQACCSEYTYASALHKRVLPVLCQDGVKVSLLPPELSKIQSVDCRGQDKQAAFALVKALQDVPQAIPLPVPLPAEPAVPVSYLGDLRGQIEVPQNLTLTEQRDILFRIRPRLKDPESSDDARELCGCSVGARIYLLPSPKKSTSFPSAPARLLNPSIRRSPNRPRPMTLCRLHCPPRSTSVAI